MGDGFEPIDDDEIVLRRIPPVWYDQERRRTSPESFKPTVRDGAGLSLWRAKYVSASELGSPGKVYYVAELLVRDLRRIGLEPVPDPPRDGKPGHCVIPQLVHSTRKQTQSREWQQHLSAHCRVSGPFGPFE